MKYFYAFAVSVLMAAMAVPAAAQYSAHDFQRSSERAAYLSWLMYKKKRDEGSNVKNWWKTTNSYGVLFSTSFDYTKQVQYDTTQGFTITDHDTVFKAKVKQQQGYSVYGGEDHLLVKLGDKGMISLSEGIQVNLLRCKLPLFDKYNPDATTDHVSFQAGIPVTLDYKWGCDVNFDPDDRVGFAVGAGAMPFYTLSLGGESVSGISPYAYASFGMYAWAYWKIRISYQPGAMYMFRNEKETTGGVTTTTQNLSSGHLIAISIGSMQYSRDWRKGRGYRTRIGEGSGGGRTGHRLNGRMF